MLATATRSVLTHPPWKPRQDLCGDGENESSRGHCATVCWPSITKASLTVCYPSYFAPCLWFLLVVKEGTPWCMVHLWQV